MRPEQNVFDLDEACKDLRDLSEDSRTEGWPRTTASPTLVGVAVFSSEKELYALGLTPSFSPAFFKPAGPDILRAVTANSALRILRRSSSGDAAYRRSFSVQSIKYFWSHSWHGPARSKILSLCLFHNFWPSLVCGGIAAALCCAVLLSLPRAPEPEAAAVLAILSGLFVSTVTLIWWPSQDSVFLDKACICQESNSLKRQGILSLGFMLKRSRAMLVLWDPTVWLRLWCVFEMAARLKLQQETPEVGYMHVMPSAHGSLMLTAQAACAVYNIAFHLLFYVSRVAAPTPEQQTLGSNLQTTVRIVAVLFVMALMIGRTLQSQLKQMGEQAHQLEQFSIKDAECFCCKHNHVDPDTGDALACDREVIEDAVVDWFGSTEVFDVYACSALMPLVVKTLILPYRYAVLVALPSLWGYMGLGACMAKAHDGFTWAEVLDPLRKGFQAAFLLYPVGLYIVIAVWHEAPSRDAGGLVRKAKASALCVGCLYVAKAMACALATSCIFLAIRVSELYLGTGLGGFVNVCWLFALVALIYQHNI